MHAHPHRVRGPRTCRRVGRWCCRWLLPHRGVAYSCYQFGRLGAHAARAGGQSRGLSPRSGLMERYSGRGTCVNTPGQNWPVQGPISGSLYDLLHMGFVNKSFRVFCEVIPWVARGACWCIEARTECMRAVAEVNNWNLGASRARLATGHTRNMRRPIGAWLLMGWPHPSFPFPLWPRG